MSDNECSHCPQPARWRVDYWVDDPAEYDNVPVYTLVCDDHVEMYREWEGSYEEGPLHYVTAIDGIEPLKRGDS
jgi:hypothetical protein